MASCGFCRAMGTARPGSQEAMEKASCAEGFRRGPAFWLKPVPPPEKLPPPFKLPYLGGWKPGQNISSCSIDYLWRGWEVQENIRLGPERLAMKEERRRAQQRAERERLDRQQQLRRLARTPKRRKVA